MFFLRSSFSTLPDREAGTPPRWSRPSRTCRSRRRAGVGPSTAASVWEIPQSRTSRSTWGWGCASWSWSRGGASCPAEASPSRRGRWSPTDPWPAIPCPGTLKGQGQRGDGVKLNQSSRTSGADAHRLRWPSAAFIFFCGVFIVAVAIAIKLIIKGKIRFFLGSREFGFLQRHLPTHYELKQKRQFWIEVLLFKFHLIFNCIFSTFLLISTLIKRVGKFKRLIVIVRLTMRMRLFAKN